MQIPSMRDVEAADLETFGAIIPEGVYTATVIECEEGISQSQKPFIQFVFQIANGPMQGRKIRDKVFITREALPIAKAKLTAIGYNTDQERQLVPAEFIGRGISITVVHEQGNNRDGLPRMYANVSVWKKVGAAQPAPQPQGIDDDIPF